MELAKAYVQIIPSAKGIKGSLTQAVSGEATSAGASAGETFGSNMVGAIAKVAAAAGIGKLFADTLSAGGDLQQSIGGVETLYGEAADAIKNYAAEAYKYGLNANDYMEQSTSFAAALKQSLGGDAVKAAEAANTALEDMADNSAKMGTDVGSLQMAYQGFAKQNYTMLDNLKIGYGGTKTEMERLLQDASKLSGVEYNIDSLSDVYEAIHVIQEDLGLTGVAADEAKTTFTGSFAAMKAAATDLMANLAIGEDISDEISALVETATTFLVGNFLPMVGNIVMQIPTIIIEGGPMILEALGQLAEQVVSTLTEQGPTWIDQGFAMIQNLALGILENAPAALENLGQVITSALTFLMDNMPEFLAKGVELLQNVGQGILDNGPEILATIVSVVADIIATFAEHLPEFLQKGIELTTELAVGIIQAIPDLLAKLPQIFSDIVAEIGSYDWLSIGINIIEGIADGVIDAAGDLVDAAIDAVKDAWDGMVNWLGIASPSKKARDFIGKNWALGIGEGFEKNMPDVEMLATVKGTMSDMSGALTVSPTIAGGRGANENADVVAAIEALEDAIMHMCVRMDDGTLVGQIDRQLGDLAARRARG